ncbi:MAG: sulfatase-like hydrolase/transferase, partial [Longimicrobiales bacterium]
TRLSRHDPDVQDWDSLPANERRLYARMMEVFAGFLEHTDHHIGRLLAAIDQLGALENTLVMLISDNGASAEGGPTGSVNENKFFNNVPESLEDNLAAIDDLGGPKYFNHYAWGWTFAGNTPFRRWKRETYRGGVSDPFIVHWPKGIEAKGEVRTQYAHAIDMVPTVFDALELEPPAAIRGATQSPIEGVSFAHTFDDASAKSLHTTQYFEMFGHRAIYHDGWRAVCPWPGTSFKEAGVGFGQMEIMPERLIELDAYGWELYHVAEDFSETKNVAESHRDKLIEMIALWYVAAGKYNVLPLDSRGPARIADERPQLAVDRQHYTYYPDTASVPENVAVRILNRRHSITASVEMTDSQEGVLLSHGGGSGGYSLFVKDGKLHYVQNYVGTEQFHVESDRELPRGSLELRFDFEPTGKPDIPHGRGTPGHVSFSINGKPAGGGDLPYTLPLAIGISEGLTVGRDDASPVSDLYEAPFPFTGTLHHVTVDVSGQHIGDPEAEHRRIMARQ